MLLSGVYYGKTPISMIFKSGERIWGTAEDQYIDLATAKIRSNVLAYITSEALEALKVEYQINVDAQSIIQSDKISGVYVSTEARSSSDTFITNNETIQLGQIDIILNLTANGVSSSAQYIPISKNIVLDQKQLLRSSIAQQGLLKQNIDIFENIYMNSSNSKQNIINNTILLKDIIQERVSASKIGIINKSVQFISEIIAHSSPSKVKNINENFIFNTHNNINTSSSSIVNIAENVVNNIVLFATSSSSITSQINIANITDFDVKSYIAKIISKNINHQILLNDFIILQKQPSYNILIKNILSFDANGELYNSSSKTINHFLNIIDKTKASIQASNSKAFDIKHLIKSKKELNLSSSISKELQSKYNIYTRQETNISISQSYYFQIIKTINSGVFCRIISSEAHAVINKYNIQSNINSHMRSSNTHSMITLFRLLVKPYVQESLSPINKMKINKDIFMALYNNVNISNTIQIYIKKKIENNNIINADLSLTNQILLNQITQISHQVSMLDSNDGFLILNNNISSNFNFNLNFESLNNQIIDKTIQNTTSIIMINAVPHIITSEKLFKIKCQSSSAATLILGNKWEYPFYTEEKNLFVTQVLMAQPIPENENLILV